MGTKLGPVEIPIKLDFSQVERDIQRIAARMNASTGGGAPLSQAGVSPGTPRATTPKAPKPPPPPKPSREMTAEEVNARLEVEVRRRARKEVEDGQLHYRGGTRRSIDYGDDDSDDQKRYARRMLSLAKRVVPGNPLSNAVPSLLGRGIAFLPESAQAGARAAVQGVGKIAAAYAIVSATAKALPTAMALGNQIAGDKPGVTSPDPLVAELQGYVEKLRQQFAWLESRVTGAIAAFQKQRDVNIASLRLSGQLPTDNERLRSMFMQDESTSREIEAKFQMWKSREAPFATAQMIFDTFKRQLNR